MKADRTVIADLRASLLGDAPRRVDEAIERIARAHREGKAVVVVTGSGPNLHEGVTTLLAELIRKDVVQGVITSSAVVGHEMAGALDRVKRVALPAEGISGIPADLLPKGNVFEITQLSPDRRAALEAEGWSDWDLYDRLAAMEGEVLIKAAGNMAWPMGPRTEKLAVEAEALARQLGQTLEHTVGLSADPRTMIGAAARHGVPVLVSIPQLVGGGAVGLAIGDAISLRRRARLIGDLLARADVIVESAVALTQEIHDGPFETYTGHGIWAAWDGQNTFSLKNKTLIRIDLDPNLELVWRHEREGAEVQAAIDRGLPKTKTTGIPFRMEMSGFARLEGSLPVTADIGMAWPLIASGLEDALGLELDFIPAPQETDAGRRMRDWIADEIEAVRGPEPRS